MDQIQIGQFIQTLRKEKNLTQKELADKVGVSDKAVSKWETGRSMPDTSLLGPLCSELGISVNELLSAEKLPPENYAGTAEVTIMELLNENKNNKKFAIVQIVLGVVFAFLSVFFLVASLFGFSGIGTAIVSYLDLPTLIIIVLSCLAAVFLSKAKTLTEVLKTIKTVVIPVGVLEMMIGLVAIWFNTGISDPGSIYELSMFLSVTHVSYAVAFVGPIYATIIYIVVSVWYLALKKNNK